MFRTSFELSIVKCSERYYLLGTSRVFGIAIEHRIFETQKLQSRTVTDRFAGEYTGPVCDTDRNLMDSFWWDTRNFSSKASSPLPDRLSNQVSILTQQKKMIEEYRQRVKTGTKIQKLSQLDIDLQIAQEQLEGVNENVKR